MATPAPSGGAAQRARRIRARRRLRVTCEACWSRPATETVRLGKARFRLCGACRGDGAGQAA